MRRLAPGARRRQAGRERVEPALVALLGAERVAPGVLLVEKRIPLAERHGCVALRDCLSAFPGLIQTAVGDPAGWLFLDTETSGLAGGTGTWAFLSGMARITGDELVLRQFLLSRLDAEAAYLAEIQRELASAELLVTYNGKAFDAPLLITRFRLAGLKSTLGAMRHIDLLVTVRRAFRRVWPNCRLTTAETRLLGFLREADLPGSEAPRAWLAWLREGEVGPLAAVLRHNRWDLLSLPALIVPLELSFREPKLVGADIRAVAAYHLARGDSSRAFATLVANRNSLSRLGLLDLARLHRRRGDLEEACRIWETMVAQGDAAAIEALAIHLEHRARDYGGALILARQLPPGTARNRRCRRLENRLRSPAGGR